ncbi:MAG: ester cyclase [Actinomycetota bacterium]
METRDLIPRFYKEVMENGNLDVIDELLAPDFVEHTLPPGSSYEPTREGVKNLIRDLTTGFSSLSIEVHDVIAQGDVAACRVTMNGTHSGEFMGLPATGKRISWDSCDWIRVHNGKAVEHWAVDDNLTMLQQLGVIPQV